jgi:hypothetical protein
MAAAISRKPEKIVDPIESEYYQNDEEWLDTIISHRVAYHDFRREIDEVKARNHEKTIM